MTVDVGLAHERDFEGILALQRENLVATPDGFVSLRHTLPILQAMHAIAPSVVARDGTAVVGYALVMPRETRALLPILEPMFVLLEALPLPPRWYVMGQVCVAASHRGRGVFDALYAAHREHYAARFDAVVTEIASRNGRSMRAHERVGFRVVARHRDATDEWNVVVWDLT